MTHYMLHTIVTLKAGSQYDARPCVASSSRLAKISCSSSKYFDQTHERNARERRDRIRVYPSVPMRYDQSQRTTDATQRKALRRIVNPPLH